jgi:hypothetical protein
MRGPLPYTRFKSAILQLAHARRVGEADNGHHFVLIAFSYRGCIDFGFQLAGAPTLEGRSVRTTRHCRHFRAAPRPWTARSLERFC